MLRLRLRMARPCFAYPPKLLGNHAYSAASSSLSAGRITLEFSLRVRPAAPPAPAVPRSVFNPDFRLPDHRAPFVGFRFQEGGQLGLGRAFRGRAQFLESRLDLGIDQRRIGVGVD